MKVAARTAKACSESSMRMASRVVTASPSIDLGVLFISSLSVRAPFGRNMRVGGATQRRLFEDALLVQAILRPVHDHRHGCHRHRILRRLKITVDGIVLMVGEVEGAIVDPTEAFPLHHGKVALLQMDVGLGVALATRELLAPGVDLVMDAKPAEAAQHHAALELAERLEPAQPHGAGGFA